MRSAACVKQAVKIDRFDAVSSEHFHSTDRGFQDGWSHSFDRVPQRIDLRL
jgi:hypothetical protein